MLPWSHSVGVEWRVVESVATQDLRDRPLGRRPCSSHPCVQGLVEQGNQVTLTNLVFKNHPVLVVKPTHPKRGFPWQCSVRTLPSNARDDLFKGPVSPWRHILRFLGLQFRSFIGDTIQLITHVFSFSDQSWEISMVILQMKQLTEESEHFIHSRKRSELRTTDKD